MKTPKERTYEWREKHAEEYRTYQRRYMRAYRLRGNVAGKSRGRCDDDEPVPGD